MHSRFDAEAPMHARPYADVPVSMEKRSGKERWMVLGGVRIASALETLDPREGEGEGEGGSEGSMWKEEMLYVRLLVG